MAKGCVYIPKTGKDAGKVFGSKETLAAHMNYTPAMADLMAKYQQAGGAMDVGNVTKWLTDNGYLKAEGKAGKAGKPKTGKTSENDGNRLSSFKKGDVVYRNYNGRYEEYTIADTSKDVWKLVSPDGKESTWNAANNGGFILKETKAAPKTTEGAKKEPIFNDDIKTNFSPSENLLFNQGGLDNLQTQIGVDPAIKSKYAELKKEVANALKKIGRVFEGEKVDLRGMSEQAIVDYANTLDELDVKNQKYGGKRAKITKSSNFGRDIQEFDGRVIGQGSFGIRIVTDDGTIVEGKKFSEYTPKAAPKTTQKTTTKKAFPKAPVTDAVKAALKNVDNTTAAIMNLAKVLPTVYESITKQIKITLGKPVSQQVAEAYHNAVENGVEPELVTAVENAVALQEQMKSKPSLADNIETAETLEMEGVPNGVRVSNKSSLADLERKHAGDATKKATIAMARAAAKTLKSVFPMMDIHLHENSADYNNAMANLGAQQNSAGNFTYSTSSDGTVVGRIDINLNRATPRTVVHEVTHAVLLKTFGDSSPAFLEFRNNLEKIISKSGNKRLSAFADKYKDITDDIGQAEEYLAELGGILSDKETPLNYGLVRRIAEMINKAVSTITFGRIKPFEDLQNQKETLEFFNTIAQSIKTGSSLENLMTAEPYSTSIAIEVNPDGTFTKSKIKSKAAIGDYIIPKGKKDLAIATVPTKSLAEVIREYNGRVVIITSDATGYGVDSKGREIYGGPGFANNLKNVLDEIGFASLNIGTVKSTYTAAENIYGQGKTLVLIMVQPPHTTINNSYGTRYFMESLVKIAKNKDWQDVKNDIKTRISTLNKITNEIGDENVAKMMAFFDKINSKSDPDALTEEYLNFTTFPARSVIAKTLMFDHPGKGVSVNTAKSKLAFLDIGVTIYDFLKEYGDQTILTEDMMREDIGGFVVAGFEIDVTDKDTREKLIVETQGKGIAHPLFNAKLPGTNHFVLDGLYGVNENFARFSKTNTEIALPTKERDQMVREIYTKTSNYAKPIQSKINAIAQNPTLSDEEKNAQIEKLKIYTNLSVTKKVEFKEKYLSKIEGALVTVLPNVATSVAQGIGFIPEKGSEKRIEKAKYTISKKLPASKFANKAQIVYDETGFISTDSMIEIVGANDPTYLGDVMNHILDMGEKLRSGNVGPKDLAKAYMMAVSSIRSGDLGISKFENAIGQKVDEVFVEKERGKIRTEGAMAYLLTTPQGERMLNNISNGKIDAKDRAFISQAMKPFGMFGEGESKFDNLFGAPSDKQINLTNINEFADMLKGGVKNEQQLFDAIAKLKGISQAKVGFVSNFLGIGTRGVIDAREIQGWMRGVVFQGERTEKEAALEKELLKSNKNLTPLQKEILRRMKVVGDAFNVEPIISEYIGHHMIWDAVKNERTTHDGLYLAMKQNEDDFNNRLAEIKAKPELKSKAQLASVEETAKALEEPSNVSVDKNYEVKKEVSSNMEFYRLTSKYGSIQGSFDKRMYEPVKYTEYPFKNVSALYLNASEVGKGYGYEVLKQLIDYAKQNGVIAINESSNNEFATRTYQKAVDEGLLIPFSKGLDGKDIGWLIKSKELSKEYKKAKVDDSNPELVKAVEDLVGKPELKSKAQMVDNNAKEVADLYAQMREGGGWAERQKINAILDQDPKLSYIYNNFKAITQMLEDAKLLTKSGNCP